MSASLICVRYVRILPVMLAHYTHTDAPYTYCTALYITYTLLYIHNTTLHTTLYYVVIQYIHSIHLYR